MKYSRPESLEAAAQALYQEPGLTRILAGGTDVLVQLKSEVVEPDLLVDLKHLAGMREVAEEAGGYRVGAGVPGAVMGEHEGIKSLWPGVVEAVELIGSTQVQGRATMVGNLCNGSPAADSVPAMIAANATARVQGPDGAREVPVADIPTGPGKTSLSKGEFVSCLPARSEHLTLTCASFPGQRWTLRCLRLLSASYSMPKGAAPRRALLWVRWRLRYCWLKTQALRWSVPNWMPQRWPL